MAENPQPETVRARVRLGFQTSRIDESDTLVVTHHEPGDVIELPRDVAIAEAHRNRVDVLEEDAAAAEETEGTSAPDPAAAASSDTVGDVATGEA